MIINVILIARMFQLYFTLFAVNISIQNLIFRCSNSIPWTNLKCVFLPGSGSLDLDLLRRMASSGVSSTVDAINEIRRTPHGISASGDALRRLLRSTVNFSTSASAVEALNFKV